MEKESICVIWRKFPKIFNVFGVTYLLTISRKRFCSPDEGLYILCELLDNDDTTKAKLTYQNRFMHGI